MTIGTCDRCSKEDLFLLLCDDERICCFCDEEITLEEKHEANMAQGFAITCLKCGSEDCSVEAKINYKKSIDITVICLDCGQVD